ncbi:hypothetical protein, partial [Brucella intermedia]|uniref:hypothetical protein n=3 Tax=Brucella/Ochrobactrum group TaxID=2826938 RepID=UPI001AECFB02
SKLIHINREPVFLSSFDLNRARDLKMSHLYLAHLSHLYIAVIRINQIICIMELSDVKRWTHRDSGGYRPGCATAINGRMQIITGSPLKLCM